METGVSLLCVFLKWVEVALQEVFQDELITFESTQMKQSRPRATHFGLELTFEMVRVLAIYNVFVYFVVTFIYGVLDGPHALI